MFVTNVMPHSTQLAIKAQIMQPITEQQGVEKKMAQNALITLNSKKNPPKRHIQPKLLVGYFGD
jgi:hypothetical protein